MAYDKLAIYNLALGHLKERRLVSLVESREPRRVLDSFWDHAIGIALSARYWKFIIRAVQIDASETVVPGFGWQYAFQIPADRVRTRNVSSSETFDPPLLQFAEEAGWWLANVSPLFVKYVSNDITLGLDLSKWTPLFADYASYELALASCLKITGSGSMLEFLEKKTKLARIRAGAVDAMNEGTKFPPQGTWVRSRVGDSNIGDNNPSSIP